MLKCVVISSALKNLLRFSFLSVMFVQVISPFCDARKSVRRGTGVGLTVSMYALPGSLVFD